MYFCGRSEHSKLSILSRMKCWFHRNRREKSQRRSLFRKFSIFDCRRSLTKIHLFISVASVVSIFFCAAFCQQWNLHSIHGTNFPILYFFFDKETANTEQAVHALVQTFVICLRLLWGFAPAQSARCARVCHGNRHHAEWADHFRRPVTMLVTTVSTEHRTSMSL